MSHLTLEQVLARSMRMSRQRAPSQIAHLFAGQKGNAADLSPHGRGPRRSNFASSLDPDARSRRLTALFDEVGMAHNTVDLLTYLESARQLGAWQDGLATFLRATRLQRAALSHPTDTHDTGAVTTDSAPPQTTETKPSEGAVQHECRVRATAAHVTTLLDMFAAAAQWSLLRGTARYFAMQYPDVVTHATTLLCNAPTFAASSGAGSEESTTSWRVGFDFVRSLSAACVPLDAYNAVLAGCERVADWRGALEVFAALGCNPIQPGRTDAPTVSATGVCASDAVSESLVRATEPVEGHVLTPNTVSYAVLLATLEQAGQSERAASVLRGLPETSRDEITASYAALIYVWSKQSTSKHGPRRRY